MDFTPTRGSELFSAAFVTTPADVIRTLRKKKYPHGRSMGYSHLGHMEAGITSAERAAKHKRREYPHGRSLGYETPQSGLGKVRKT